MRQVFIIITLLLCMATSKLVAQSNASNIGLAIGNEAPEIKLPNPKGDTIALSSLQGKIVLIDFWASWCAPCLKEQPGLRSLYKKYTQSAFVNANGFEIYSISLDSKKTEWANAIKKFKMNWAQVSDLKFWNSGAANLYNVEEIPFNILIDGNGIIVARDLHGEDLNKELLRLVKKN